MRMCAKNINLIVRPWDSSAIFGVGFRVAFFSLFFGFLAESFAVSEGEGFRSPEVINARLLYAADCDCVAYSSNKNNYFKPFLLRSPFSESPLLESLQVAGDRDYLVQDISSNGEILVLISDLLGDDIYDIFIYNARTNLLENVTLTPDVNEYSATLSPDGTKLSYLSGGVIHLRSLIPQGTVTSVRTERPLSFRSVQWSPDGKSLVALSGRNEIWSYSIDKAEFELLWREEGRNFSLLHLRPYSSEILFSSDMSGDFLQIYSLDRNTRVLKMLTRDLTDHYSPVRLADRSLSYRSVHDGSYRLRKLTPDLDVANGPLSGVVYQEINVAKGRIALFANEHWPRNIFKLSRGGKSETLPPPLLEIKPLFSARKFNRFQTSDGALHFYLEPEGGAQSWILFLHGGPHEQVSPRYNYFFDLLVEQGLGVLALNYPGSTGRGNKYELHHIPSTLTPDLQIAAIYLSLKEFAEQRPEKMKWGIFAVSYGARLAYKLAEHSPVPISHIIDFSGLAVIEDLGPKKSLPDQVLSIYGQNDFALEKPGRKELLDYVSKKTTLTRFSLPGEGHILRQRKNSDQIIKKIQSWLP